MELGKIRLHLLKKQNLLLKERASNYLTVIKDHLGLHSTDYLTPYLSLWSRVENFNPKALFDDLYKPQNTLRTRAFRGTLFVIHKDNFEIIWGSTKYFRNSRMTDIRNVRVSTDIDFELLVKELQDLLKGGNQLTLREIKKELEGHWEGDQVQFVLRYLVFEGVVGRTKHRHITDRFTKYGLLNNWLPEIFPLEMDQQEALVALMRKYIRRFGPICLEDFCWWVPITKTETRKALEKLKEELIEFDFNNKQYLMEKNDFEEMEQCENPFENEPIVNFLPYEDHFPKAYKIRGRYISSEIYSKLFGVRKIDRGEIRPSIWLNGEIVGRWEQEWADKRKDRKKVIIVHLNQKLVRSEIALELIEEQRSELESFINEQLLPLSSKNVS